MVAKNERAPIEPFAAAAPEAPGPTVSTRFEEAALRLEDGNFDWLLSLWRRSLRVDALNLAQPTSGRSRGRLSCVGIAKFACVRGCLFDGYLTTLNLCQ
jgi:hypothetical protein